MLNENTHTSETCRRVRSWWQERFDGQIMPTHESEVETHLRRCFACRRYAAQMEAIAAALRKPEVYAAASDQRVIEPVQTTEPPTIPLLRLRRLAGLAACLLLSVTVGGLSMLQLSDIKRVTQPTPPGGEGAEPPAVVPLAPLTDLAPTAYLRLVGPSAATQVAVKRSAGSPGIHVFTLFPTDRVALGDRLRSSTTLSLPVTQEKLQ